MEQNFTEKVNIKKVFYEKNPALAKLLPGFVFGYLKKIAHENEVNAFLDKHGTETNIDFINASLHEFNIKLTVEGLENLPENDRLLFVANHPLGGFDGMLIIKTIYQQFGSVRVLSNDILMNIKNLQELFIPINKYGRQASDFVNAINNAYASNFQLLTFPSGYVSRKIKGQVMDFAWQKSFINKSKQFKRTIIPTFISGSNSNFFYRLHKLRSFLGIKANLEMLYLVDETFKHRNKHFTIKFGQPIPYQTFNNSKKTIEWAKWVKEQVYALNGNYVVPV